VDNLTNNQRSLAWWATWNPSFDGKAIADSALKIQSVNEQFCEMLGASPAELINHTLTDLTPEPAKSRVRENAELVVQGKSPGFLVEIEFEFLSGRRMKALLMVVGVFVETDPPTFDFFVSRILNLSAPIAVPPPCPRGSALLNAIRTNWQIIAAAVGALAWVASEAYKLTREDG